MSTIRGISELTTNVRITSKKRSWDEQASDRSSGRESGSGSDKETRSLWRRRQAHAKQSERQ